MCVNVILQGTTVRVEFGDTTTAADPTDANTISRYFPNTYGQPLAHFLRATAKVAGAQVISEHPAMRYVHMSHFTSTDIHFLFFAVNGYMTASLGDLSVLLHTNALIWWCLSLIILFDPFQSMLILNYFVLTGSELSFVGDNLLEDTMSSGAFSRLSKLITPTVPYLGFWVSCIHCFGSLYLGFCCLHFVLTCICACKISVFLITEMALTKDDPFIC